MSEAKVSDCFVIVFLLFGVFASPVIGGAQAGNDSISFDGFGPVKIGMTRAAAEGALGTHLQDDLNVHSKECYFLTYVKGDVRVDFMVTNAKISRVDVFKSKPRTNQGAGVGDSEAKIKSLYGKGVSVKQHAYLDKGHYLIIHSADHARKMVFETDGAVVTSFRSGKEPEVEYIEGCE